jgi:hypothetical protein
MKRIRPAIPCLVTVLAAGCASEGFEVSAHTQSVAYRERVDPSLILRADPPNCAILPGLTPTTAGGLAAHIDMTFLLALRAAAPGGSVLSSGESIARMNAAGIAGEWHSLAADYGQTGVLDRERLSRIGKALGVTHVVIPTLGYLVTNAEQQLQPFDITIAVTIWVSVYTSLQVWNVELGTVEWSSTASCSVAIETVAAAGYPIHQALRKSWDQMLADLIENRGGSVLREKLSPEAMQDAMAKGAADSGDRKPTTGLR